jgi:outer membrane protein assembly factor BamB
VLAAYHSPVVAAEGQTGRGSRNSAWSLLLSHETPLPGPLSGGAMRVLDGRVEIPVANGIARVDWAGGGEVEVVGAPPPAKDATEWAVAPGDGRHRARVLDDGRLLLEKRCVRCRRGWRRAWKARLGGSAGALPVFSQTGVLVGAMDNRIYCLMRKNGHRVWTADLSSRLSSPLALLTTDSEPSKEGGSASGPSDREFLVVVPDDGSALVVFEPHSGLRVASFRAPGELWRLIGPPATTPDGRVVVLRQHGYRTAEAGLLVFDLVPGDPQLEAAEAVR